MTFADTFTLEQGRRGRRGRPFWPPAIRRWESRIYGNRVLIHSGPIMVRNGGRTVEILRVVVMHSAGATEATLEAVEDAIREATNQPLQIERERI